MRWLDVSFICCMAIICRGLANGEENVAPDVVVNAAEDESEHDQFTEPGEYAQPAWAERSRMSSTTSVYVLSPYEMFVGNIWEGDLKRHGKSAHDFTQEIDLGLLHRFEIGFENELGVIGDDGHETSGTVEARYALGNWNAIPLNPAISLEYVFGLGKSVKSAKSSLHHHGAEILGDQPDAVAGRLLLGQDFAGHFGYGLNLSLQQDVSHDSGRTFQLSQSITYGAVKGKMEIGAEMRYQHTTPQSEPNDQNELVIGPSFGWKPARQVRIAFAPLFGCTGESPRLATFLLLSYEFGGAEAVVPTQSQTNR